MERPNCIGNINTSNCKFFESCGWKDDCKIEKLEKQMERILCHAHDMIKMYKDVSEFCKDDFERSIRQQGYRDALENMKRYRLIKDYDLSNYKIIS